MIEGIFISSSGMLPKATRQEAIANNLANVEVPGFKRDNLFMREVLEAKKRLSGDYPDWRLNRIEGLWTDMDQGDLRRTGDMFDMALTGQGFFAVRTPEGVRYTRNGNFTKNSEGMLVTPLGYPILDENNAEITLPENVQVPLIDGTGTVRAQDELTGEAQLIGKLQIVDFPDLYDRVARAQCPFQPPLQKSPVGLFIAQPGTRQVPAEGVKVSQGYLEESNVNPVLEMVKMIDIFRAYEADQRAVQIQDGTLDRAVNDVGVVRR